MRFRQFVEFFGRKLHERCHLVDERARSARARAVHSHLESARQENYFRVLAAEFDNGVCIREKPRNGGFFGVNFLNKWKIERFRNAHSRRTRQANRHFLVAEFIFRFAENFYRRFGDFRKVSLIF